MKKYTVIGGVPFRSYTGTTTFTNLCIIGHCNNLKELNKLVDINYEKCAGLMLIIDNETGLEQNDKLL